MQKMTTFLAVWVLLTLMVAGCKPGVSGLVSELSYLAPLEKRIPAGEELPGVPIRYVGLSDKGAEVLIAGERAFKQKGDSLDWHGSPAEGVELALSLRALWYTEETLYMGGTTKMIVYEPDPRPGPITTSPMEYHAPVVYVLSQGDCIPGTTIEYLGKTEKGAKLGGVEGYSYRKLGDSIVWEGQLRDNVFLRLNVRSLFIAEDSLNVGGTATIWVVP
ncbi:MAG: hypothetical protein U9R11_02120 [Chloroflexota bacterium]|nr:hypothetical protein [Chloroflexota bacterium]